MLRSFKTLAFCAVLLTFQTAQAAEPPVAATATAAPVVPYIIGTGAVTGIYFPAAGAVQRLVNDKNFGIHLAVQSTNGSISNLQDLIAGKLDLAIVQSDWAYYATKGGIPPFMQPNTDLRAIIALHPELLTIIVKKESSINKIDDLKGKKINLGPTGSGPRTIINSLIQTLGWSMTDMGSMLDIPVATQSAALCNGQVDAIVYLVPHPNAAVQEALSRCSTRLLPISGHAVDTLVANNPFYTKANILGSSYTGMTADTPSFGVRALLVGTNRLPDEAAYAIAKAAYNDITTLNSLHPSVARLTTADLKASSYGLPLHNGVAKFIAESAPQK